ADIDALEAWNISTGSSEVIIGVIDTGVDYNHQDLAANIWSNPGEIPSNGVDDDGNGYVDDVHGINAITGSGDPMDDHYHGTHCSGTVAGIGNNGVGVVGVCWTAKIIGIKFLDSSGSGSTADAIECVNYAIWLKNNGTNIRVLSNSWGGGGFDQTLRDAIDAAGNVGILFTAAAGNNYGNNNDTNPFYPATYDCANILAVASTDHNDNLSGFSNMGATTVDLGAPGSSILSTFPNNSYSILSGTSMATPHVSGVTGLLLSVNYQLTVQELKGYLMDYGDAIPALNGNCLSGKRLNAYGSLSQVSPPGSTFRLSATPTAQSVNQGDTAAYTINIESVLGFSDPVTLSAESNPAINAAITFTPNPGTSGSTSLMQVVTTTSTDPTDYQIAITGVSGGITKTTNVTLTVQPESLITVSYTNNTVIPIPDYPGSSISSDIYVPDNLTVWNTACEVHITHTWIGDLIVRLRSPTGTEAILHNREGSSAHNIHQTYYPGDFRNEPALGTWTLLVSDHAGIDIGTLDSWGLTISGYPLSPVNQPPVSDFSFSVSGLSVTFNDQSYDPDGTVAFWNWDFGDGGSSINQNTNHSYVSAGAYPVTLTVTDDEGANDSVTKNVTVMNNEPPVADFTANRSVVIEGDIINLTDQSTNSPTTWEWTFTGGIPAISTEQNPTTIYNTSGTYTVTLTASNSNGSDTETKIDYITVIPPVTNGIGGYDFLSTNDQAFSFDDNGDGKQDLLTYRPGSGAVFVLRSDGNGTFTPVYAIIDNGYPTPNGIGTYDLLSINDRAFPFDYDGDGKDDLFFYRPGNGAANVVRSNGDGTFTSVYDVLDNGYPPPNGIGAFDLLSIRDQVFPFDYNGDGKEDLCLYRPGNGAINVVRSNGDGTFTSVYDVLDNGYPPPNGIGAFDLLSTRDQIFPFDYNGDGKEDLCLYRPGNGAINVVRSNGDGTFTSVYDVLDNGSAPPNGIGAFDLLSTRDQVFPFDYNGDGKEDLCLYRPGSGAINIVHSNGGGTFTSVYDVIDNGSLPPNGIAGYNLLSTNDRIFPFNYDGDRDKDLFLYRPGGGLVGVINSTRGWGGIDIMSPNGGEILEAGTIQDITWWSSGYDGNVEIDCSFDNGQNWSEISPTAPNDGSFPWTIPDNISSQCLLKVSKVDGVINDFSDEAFSIAPHSPESITVTSPNGNENLEVGASYSIYWSSSGFEGDVRIEYSTDNGSNWISIIKATNNDGSHIWVVPDNPSINCSIRISQCDPDEEVFDVSDELFSIIPQSSPALRITSPNGGERLTIGYSYPITWTSNSASDYIRIEYSTDNGTSWTYITITANDGNYNWTIPDSQADNCLLRIKETDGYPTDVSDTVFSIVPQSSIIIISPNGGETLPVGSSHTITWTSNGILDDLRIEYSTDNGSSWLIIVPATANDGSHPWTIPNIHSANCLVRIIENKTDEGLSDVSDTEFTIFSPSGKSLTVISPNGGENLEVGSSHTITWTSSGILDDVKLEYSTDKGSSWSSVVASTATDGSHPWIIPNTPTNNCLIRISEVDVDGGSWDVSDTVFSIVQASDPIIRIVSPDGGERLSTGETFEIKRICSDTVGQLNIEYSTNRGTTWTPIENSIENDGYFQWTIPNNPSENCLLKISESDGEPFDVSNAPFMIVSQPSIVVTSPNGKEKWEVGSTQNITWSSTGSVSEVAVEYSINKGFSWANIVSATANDGTSTWIVPDMPSDDCLIRVNGISSVQESPSDMSDDYFSIFPANAGSITITSPNGREELIVDSSFEVSWISTGEISHVNIEYSTNRGVSWFAIVSSTENKGSYNWIVPNKPSEHCLIRISDSNMGFSDTNDEEFSIISIPSITITSPNGGENWDANSYQDITWTCNEIISDVRIEYSINNGGSWNIITQTTDNDGIFIWLVPNDISDNCLIRLNELDSDEGVSDVSDAVFSIIAGTPLGITSPDGGEIIQPGKNFAVTWGGDPDLANVNLEYSTDNGAAYSLLDGPLPNTGHYEWQAPQQNAQNCLLRISSAERIKPPKIILLCELEFVIPEPGSRTTDSEIFVVWLGNASHETLRQSLPRISFSR
ncbi:MAG: S8 family serine peptidase, partial [Candidatus Aminicenantes bacterium]|nr:S8 family serine peptidase [Candidatus Aminicenantes bacterium]